MCIFFMEQIRIGLVIWSYHNVEISSKATEKYKKTTKNKPKNYIIIFGDTVK